MEGEAVLTIVTRSKRNNDEIIGSPAVDLEIDQIADIEKREKVRCFYEQATTKKADYTEETLKRVRELSSTNIRTLDRFHLSFAENAGAEILLTTDTKFEKSCLKLNLGIKVLNPLNYLMEVLINERGA